MADIVVIDDEPCYRRLIAQVLTGAGHQVRQAEDGAEGLAMCLQRTPQLVITDIVMPGMEGIETILRLMRERPGVAVLAISGAEPASIYLRAATALGATASLPKPFTVDQLLMAVGRLLAADRALPAQSADWLAPRPIPRAVPCAVLTFTQPSAPACPPSWRPTTEH